MAAERSELAGLVEEFVAGQVDSKAEDVAAGVKAGRYTVLELVEALGLSLTSSQSQTRGRGVQLLSNVLQELYTDLTQREVEVLIDFYENRLKDHYTVTPHVLHGLKALAKSSVLPAGSAVSILKSIFQDVHVQSLMLAERSCVYNMLMSLMESREEELKGLGPDFVFGFVQAVDGERDPRNLLLAFQIAKNIIYRGYDLSQFTEELFEVTSCYFPIDFTPPPNDPHGITQEELIQTLRNVLTGTPRFAEFLLPLLIEKLDSDVQNAKVDSLHTLAACAPVYGYKDVCEFLPSLWSSIRREVFQTTSERVEAAGLSALAGLTSCLSRSVLTSDSEDALQVFLNLLLKDCLHYLSEPDLKLVWCSAKLLQVVSGASYRSSLIVTAAVLPVLLDQYNSRTQCAQRRTLLEVLHGFIQPTQSSRPAEGEDSVLLPFQSSLLSVMFSALTESSAGLQITAMKILTSLSEQPGLLCESDVERAVDHLTRLILEEVDVQVSVCVVECSGSLSRLHPEVFRSHLIPKLTHHIFSSDSASPEDLVKTRLRCFSALASVSTQLSLVQDSTPVLLQVLTSVHTGSSSVSVEEVISVCRSLQRIAEHTSHSDQIRGFFHNLVIPQLLGLCIQAALQSEKQADSCRPLTQEAVLSAIVPVISTACSSLQTDLASQMVSQVVSLFLDGDTSSLPDNTYLSPIHLLKSQSWSLTQLVCLLMACVCSLPRNVDVPELERLLEQLEDLSCTSSHGFTFTSAAKCFSGLINKRAAGPALDAVLEKTLKRIRATLDSETSTQRVQAFTLLVWVAKALLLRYHPKSSIFTDQLFSLLTDAELSSEAADSFRMLMIDSSDVLKRSCNADVRIMYRQRFFTENSDKLVHGFNSAEKEKKSVYLKALSHIVNHLPREVQLSELPALLPLLLEALSCPDQDVQMSTLSCLQPVLQDPPPALNTQLEALITRILTLTSSPDMKVRIAALRCVHALSRLPEHLVLPFRARVLRSLAVPLDDKKRLVRREAVSARGEWFLLGSPGGR